MSDTHENKKNINDIVNLKQTPKDKNRTIIKPIYDNPAIKGLNTGNSSVKSVIESITKNRETINSIYDNPAIKGLNTRNFSIKSVIESMTKVKLQLEGVEFNDIFINNYGTISYSGDIISLDDTVDRFIPYIEENISIEHKINNTIEDFKKDNPLKYKIIKFIVYFFIINLFQAYYNQNGLKLINTKIGNYKQMQMDINMISKKERTKSPYSRV